MFRTVLVTVLGLSAALIAGCHAGGEASRDSGLADSALDASGSDGGHGDADADADGDTDADGDADGDSDASDSGIDAWIDPRKDASPPECVRFVNGEDHSSGDGMSWNTSFQTVQHGIDSAYDAILADGGPGECEVWVSRGSYYIYQTSPDDTILLKPGILLLGGFAGHETFKCQRDWQSNPTILDGHKDGNIPDASPDSSNNQVFHIITGCGNSTIDGFRISGGGSSTANDPGGGIKIPPESGNMHISNILMINNIYYAIANFSTKVSANACIFRENNGGILNSKDAEISISNSIFNGNGGIGIAAGAIVNGSSMNISNCFFTLNVPGAIDNWGNSLTVSNGIFYYNSSYGGAGAIYTTGGTEIVNCVFFNNDLIASGPIPPEGAGALAGGDAVIYNSIFWINSPIDYENTEGNAFRFHNCLFNDPLFVDAPPVSWPYVDAGEPDLHLQAGSPCIDEADDSKAPPTDIEGHGRVDIPNVGIPGVKADVGAYEYRPKKR